MVAATLGNRCLSDTIGCPLACAPVYAQVTGQGAPKHGNEERQSASYGTNEERQLASYGAENQTVCTTGAPIRGASRANQYVMMLTVALA